MHRTTSVHWAQLDKRIIAVACKTCHTWGGRIQRAKYLVTIVLTCYTERELLICRPFLPWHHITFHHIFSFIFHPRYSPSYFFCQRWWTLVHFICVVYHISFYTLLHRLYASFSLNTQHHCLRSLCSYRVLFIRCSPVEQYVRISLVLLFQTFVVHLPLTKFAAAQIRIAWAVERFSCILKLSPRLCTLSDGWLQFKSRFRRFFCETIKQGVRRN